MKMIGSVIVMIARTAIPADSMTKMKGSVIVMIATTAIPADSMTKMNRYCNKDFWRQYRGTAHALKQIISLEGWRGLYAGLLPSVIGSSVSWGLYFFAYNQAKRGWQSKEGPLELKPWQHLVSAAEAGCMVRVKLLGILYLGII